MKNKNTALLILCTAFLSLGICLLAGCKNWLDNAQVQAVIADATPVIENDLSEIANGSAKGNAIALGLQSVAQTAGNIANDKTLNSNQVVAQVASLVQSTAATFAGDPQAKQVGADLVAILKQQMPANPTSTQVAQAVSVAGVVVSNAANH